MTTLYDFTPSTSALFQFQPTLDGRTYNVLVPWSLFGRRYYVNCYALDGTLVFSVPLVGSPVGIAVQSLTWEAGAVFGVAVAPHGFPVGATVSLTVAGASPDAYNGAFDALIVDAVSFAYPLPADPGTATAFGSISKNLNLAAGYFDSTLVYRAANGQFEVSP